LIHAITITQAPNTGNNRCSRPVVTRAAAPCSGDRLEP
jgi:hypothetical protein